MKDPNRIVRSFDNRVERLVDPQGPARTWLGQPVKQTGYILPYGKGGYRHSFSDCGCGCSGGCGGMGDDTGQGLPFMAWVLLIGGGLALGYTLLHAAGPQRRRT